MQKKAGRDQLDSERTLVAAERTFSAWIRTGLAGGGGAIDYCRDSIVDYAAMKGG